MTLLLILSLIIVILITYLLGTWIANVVIRRRDKREAKERAEYLNVILSFK